MLAKTSGNTRLLHFLIFYDIFEAPRKASGSPGPKKCDPTQLTLVAGTTFFQGSNFLEICKLQFEYCVINKNKQECETVAFFYDSTLAKTRENARGLHFLYILLNSTEKHMLSSTLISKNVRKCERGAYFHMFFAILPKINKECKHIVCVFSTPLD